MWCLERLHDVISSPLGKLLDITSMLQSDTMDTSLSCLLKTMPVSLLKQYEYEDPAVKGGKQLMYSPFFKVILSCLMSANNFSPDVQKEDIIPIT